MKQLTQRLVERMLEGEMNAHLGYEKHAASGRNGGNSRNGHESKKLQSDHGTLELAVPRDREGSFDPW